MRFPIFIQPDPDGPRTKVDMDGDEIVFSDSKNDDRPRELFRLYRSIWSALNDNVRNHYSGEKAEPSRRVETAKDFATAFRILADEAYHSDARPGALKNISEALGLLGFHLDANPTQRLTDGRVPKNQS